MILYTNRSSEPAATDISPMFPGYWVSVFGTGGVLPIFIPHMALAPSAESLYLEIRCLGANPGEGERQLAR